jgi:5-methyltetrahydropteroyltriglutamate--homocysteine methyltransferase
LSKDRTAQVIAGRIRNGLKHVAAERLVVAADCGMSRSEN